MNASFYSGARGMITEQDKLNVIGNNVANVNTVGYKSKSSVFMDLMYYNMHSQDRVTTGTGVRMQHTNTDFTSNGMSATQGGGFNFAIQDGEGFFMLRDQVSNEITYTRAGNFSVSLHNDGYFYLLSDGRKYVLDETGTPIRYVNEQLTGRPAVFTFANTNNMESVGATEFRPVPKNGNPMLVRDAQVVHGYLELSNVDMAQELSDTVIASRAYTYALKMVQTSDEIEQTINGLRS